MARYRVAVMVSFPVWVEVDGQTQEQARNAAKARVGVMRAAEAAAQAPQERVRVSVSRDHVDPLP